MQENHCPPVLPMIDPATSHAKPYQKTELPKFVTDAPVDIVNRCATKFAL